MAKSSPSNLIQSVFFLIRQRDLDRGDCFARSFQGENTLASMNGYMQSVFANKPTHICPDGNSLIYHLTQLERETDNLRWLVCFNAFLLEPFLLYGVPEEMLCYGLGFVRDFRNSLAS